MHCKGKSKGKKTQVRSYSMAKKKKAPTKVRSYSMAKKKGKAFKACRGCPHPAKCKKAGKCLLHKH
jgi:hypothetical protein